MKIPMELFLYKQEPIDIFRERIKRMRLIAFAPSLSYFILLLSVTVYISIKKGVVVAPKIDTTSVLISLAWLLATLNLIRLAAIKAALDNPSTLFRFVFDGPILVILLIWILYCFHSTGSYEHPFLIALYALFVYSGSRMVSIPFYMTGTHAIGIILCLVVQHNYSQIFCENAPEQFTKGAVIEAFISLYAGLFFSYIQETFVWLFRLIAKLLSILLYPVFSDDDQR